MRQCVLTLLGCLVLVLAGCAEKHARFVQVPGGCYVTDNPCSLMLKQSKVGFDFGGLTFTSGAVSKVGEVKVNTDLMQKMTDIAQILDQEQFASCQRLKGIDSCNKTRDVYLAAEQAEQMQLAQLAIIMQASSGKPDAVEQALEKWLLRSSDLLDKIYAKQFTGTNPEVEAKRAKADAAAQFAINKLGISRGTPEYQQALISPVQAELQ